jgi:hypothetical protein
MAHDAIQRLLKSWSTADPTINYSLHFAAVTLYARPFLPTPTSRGKIQYPVKRLKGAPGFDQELHLHIVDVRNRLVAHRDYGVSRSTMYMQLIGDERLPIALGANVKVLAGIHRRELAERYEKHLGACKRWIEEVLKREMESLGEEALRNPTAFDSTNNMPEDEAKVSISTEDQLMPGPSGSAGAVEDPKFASQLAGYRYEMLTHRTPLVKSGVVKLHVHGVLQEITITVPFDPRGGG